MDYHLCAGKMPACTGYSRKAGNGYSYENLNEFSEIVSGILKEPLWMEKAAEHEPEQRTEIRDRAVWKYGTEPVSKGSMERRI